MLLNNYNKKGIKINIDLIILNDKKKKRYEYNKKWYLKNKDLCRAKAKAKYVPKPRKDPFLVKQNQLYLSCKSHAKTRGLEFDIVQEDLVMTTHCPILGVPFTLIKNQGKQNYNPSVDRIDNTKGYIKGNVWVISLLANRMKHTATIEQLILFSKGILKIYEH